VHGEATLAAHPLLSLLALGTVAPGQVPPAGLVSHWLATLQYCVLDEGLGLHSIAGALGCRWLLARLLSLGGFLLLCSVHSHSKDQEHQHEGGQDAHDVA